MMQTNANGGRTEIKKKHAHKETTYDSIKANILNFPFEHRLKITIASVALVMPTCMPSIRTILQRARNADFFLMSWPDQEKPWS